MLTSRYNQNVPDACADRAGNMQVQENRVSLGDFLLYWK
jgi:hypothetical protein